MTVRSSLRRFAAGVITASIMLAVLLAAHAETGPAVSHGYVASHTAATSSTNPGISGAQSR